ncbi:MAG TPA: hypothetical protein VG474_12445 [Solirubrobacteraceae bacterium]|nr:hypothetical protein [Solirubrobacteraceae bacterium]
MAPATFAGAALQARNGRGAAWNRDSVIIAIREWVATYGEPPRAADWNPSSAKWSGQPWRIERYRAGRADGSPWPALNSAKRPFGGSLSEAIRAAGFEPARPGPRRRTEVDPEQAHRAVMSPEARAMLAAALAQAREAERRVALLETRLERVAEPKVVRERVVDDAALARAERRATTAEAKVAALATDARERVAVARMAAAEARSTAKRLAAKLERAEATIGTLSGERRRLEAAGDRRAAADAELRAARAERELRETVGALRGEARRLTAAELAELRTRGPSGPAVMAEALAALAAARRTNNPTRMQDALRRVAQAAVTWQERI